jgi:CheY-like chemotaxis protein
MTISPSIANSPDDSSASYPIDCHACGVTYDALQAEWCHCIVKERTLVCPSCAQCFCRSELDYKRTVWTAAPDALWERKQSNARGQALLAENPPPESVARPLVLVIDDDRDIRALSMHLVTGWGYGCIHAANGIDGLALARAYRPDLILTDALMPKMDGRELCRLVKADPEIGNTRVVIMSSVYTSGRFKREALAHFKADEYLAKPVDAAQFRRLVDDVQKRAAAPDPEPEAEGWVPADALPLPDLAQTLLSPDAANDTLRVVNRTVVDTTPAQTPTPEPRLRLTARELIRLRALGLDADLASAADVAPALRAVDLIAVRTAGVPLEFIQSIEPDVLATLTAPELITLHGSGCEAEAINLLRHLEFDVAGVIGLIASNVPMAFVRDAIAAAGRPLTSTELIRLHAAAVELDYVRALGPGTFAVDEWIRFWTLGVPPEFLHAAAGALRETCSHEELLQLWLSGVDAALLDHVRDGI